VSVLEPPVAPRAEFAEELWERLARELDRRSLRAPARTLLLAAALLLVVAAVASATYLGLRVFSDHGAAKPAQVTAISGSTIVALSPSGSRVVWHCPRPVFCGDLQGFDWARNGRRLAFTLGELGGTSAYIGLHIVDVATGRDVHLPRVRVAHPLRPSQPKAAIERFVQAMFAQLGCWPQDVAWSPSGRRLAYGCTGDSFAQTHRHGVLFTITAAGRDRRTIRTGTRAAFSPSWSPDGKRIVFATGAYPSKVVAFHPTVTRHSNIYLVGTDGRGRRLLVHDAAEPDWSANSQAIAYESVRGVRLVTPQGRDITPAKGLPHGVPRWSPDDSQLAIQTGHGMLVYDTHTWHALRLTSRPIGGAIFGAGAPAWYPGPFTPAVRATQGARRCASCF
jgi:hypothetical protein